MLERLRSAFSGLGSSWLDVKLGLRMLVRHPGLTLVAVFALSIGIPASLIPTHILDAIAAPLPFEDADRIVGIRNRNIAENQTQVRSLHDFFVWREEVTTFEAIAAARTDPYNVISDDGRAASIRGSEISAAAFRILRVPPFMGRTLIESDEVPGAPEVVLLSHDVWQSRMAGDPDAVGKTIRIGETQHVVVGVMPPGFLFPMNDRLWIPLRDLPTEYERGMGPDVATFGRLADGATIEDARAELETIGARLATEFPETNERLRPQVMGYTAMLAGIDAGDRTEIYLIQLIAIAMLAIVCGNVGTLILARTSTRSGEIAIRTALGASRGRIVTQLFVEALVLAVFSAGIGLVGGHLFGEAFARRAFLEAPFWFDLGVKPKTVATALGIAAFCAVIAGVVPALKSTGRHVQHSLQSARTGGAVRFGGVSTLLIVAEVAMAVGFLTLGGTLSQGLIIGARVEKDIDAGQFFIGMLRIPWTDHSAFENDLRVEDFRNEVRDTHLALLERLSNEPGVRGVALAGNQFGGTHPMVRIEIADRDQGEGFEGYRVRQARVDVGYFSGLGAPIRMGRDFTSADIVPDDPNTVIVNTTFVERVLGGRNPIGQRLRYVVPEDQDPAPWFEVVGVVGHLGMNEGDPTRDQGFYRPAAPGWLHPIFVSVHVGDDPLSFAPRLREIVAEVDPQAMVQYPFPMDDVTNGERQASQYGSWLLFFLSGVAVVLSSAGLYALMSFTVSQRTREIGVRTALGAGRGRIFVSIARRAFFQLVAGTVAGLGLGYWLVNDAIGTTSFVIDPWLILAACAAFMFAVGLLACVAPTIKGLRIRPVEALKEG